MTRWPARELMQERILETADRLFYQQGIRAVGVDTVAAEIGISKRTLYNYFPSKDELIIAYLTRRFVPIKHSDRPPLEQILRIFDWLERWFASDTFRGCAFANAVTELGDAAHPVCKIALGFKEQRRVWVRDILQSVGIADPDGLSMQIAILFEGAISSALIRGDPGIARCAKAAARVLLTAAGVPEPAEAAAEGEAAPAAAIAAPRKSRAKRQL
jgi:AcrR family transcriptional regulator